MISILMLSWNRLDKLNQTLEINLSRCGCKFELLICDQGSDLETIKYLDSFNPTYFRQNKKNEGVGKSLNQLYLRSTGKYIAPMSNDLILPEGWGTISKEWLDKIPNSGLCGINWGHDGCPPLYTKHGFEAHWLKSNGDRIFGPTMFRRELIESIGLFGEDFDVYGLEDSSFNERVNRSGYQSFYLPKIQAQHIGHDVGEDSDYRRMKDESMNKNLGIFHKKLADYESGGSLIEHLPEHRDPLL